jgi:hypothetical protein
MVLQPSSENLPSIADPAGYLLASPPGTVLPHPNKPDVFWVRGSECVYETDAGSYRRRRMPACECMGWRRWRHCKHLQAVSAYLQRLRLCPVCWGARALHIPSGAVRYVDVHTGVVDLSPLPCVGCLGSGTREAWERAGRFPAEAA